MNGIEVCGNMGGVCVTEGGKEKSVVIHKTPMRGKKWGFLIRDKVDTDILIKR